jgi:hypothetical protein
MASATKVCVRMLTLKCSIRSSMNCSVTLPSSIRGPSYDDSTCTPSSLTTRCMLASAMGPTCLDLGSARMNTTSSSLNRWANSIKLASGKHRASRVSHSHLDSCWVHVHRFDLLCADGLAELLGADCFDALVELVSLPQRASVRLQTGRTSQVGALRAISQVSKRAVSKIMLLTKENGQ